MTQSKSRQKQSYFLAFFLLIFFLSLDIQVFANCEQLQEKIVRKIGLEADPSASLEGISISQASNKDRVALNKFIKNQRKLVGIDQPLLEGKSNLDSDLLDIKTNFPKKAAEFLIIKNKFGEILGTGAFSRKSIRKMNGKTEEVYYSGFTAEIKKLYLDPRLQGKGIGKDFIEHLIEEAQKKGYESIELETFETWESALKLYKKLGFQEYERFQNLNEPVSIRMLLAFEKKWPTHVFQNSQAKLEFVKSVQKALD